MSRKFVFFLVLVLLIIGSSTTFAQKDSDTDNGDGDEIPYARALECDNGVEILNGVELTIVQQRAGNQYRITVVGIDGFDPVLAVTDQNNNGLCNDDSEEAADYIADLPTTGEVDSSSLNSQVLYTLNSSEDFSDISVVVGGFAGQGGEFLVIVEGMFASELDGAGDPFSLFVSPALIDSDVLPTGYMISVVAGFDPLMALVDADLNVLEDEDGNPVACDDAGNDSLCWGDHFDLSSYYVSRSSNRVLGGNFLDSMMTIPVTEDFIGGFLNFIMRGNNTEGDYVAVFHLGTAEVSAE